MTYAEIADIYGCSRQNVGQACTSKQRLYVRPKWCIYEGLRDWMNENCVSRTELFRRMYGHDLTDAIAGALRRRMTGASRWRMDEINKVLDVTGLTYEELFRSGS
jgi:hypothetical protein